MGAWKQGVSPACVLCCDGKMLSCPLCPGWVDVGWMEPCLTPISDCNPCTCLCPSALGWLCEVSARACSLPAEQPALWGPLGITFLPFLSPGFLLSAQHTWVSLLPVFGTSPGSAEVLCVAVARQSSPCPQQLCHHRQWSRCPWQQPPVPLQHIHADPEQTAAWHLHCRVRPGCRGSRGEVNANDCLSHPGLE